MHLVRSHDKTPDLFADNDGSSDENGDDVVRIMKTVVISNIDNGSNCQYDIAEPCVHFDLISDDDCLNKLPMIVASQMNTVMMLSEIMMTVVI